MQIYNNLSFKLSKVLTNAYSTSFSIGIQTFSKEYRDAIYGIYGFVRIADEIVDSFHDYDRKNIFIKFREDTFDAIKNRLSTNPILHAFQEVVNEYNIKHEYIEAFLDSMAADLYESSYEREKYNKYIYGSAEVVGLMCLQVFCKNNNELFDELLAPARSLGSAFQKVNFLRDIKSDLEERGRIYLPDIHNIEMIDNENKNKLEDEIEQEFNIALKGIYRLPVGVRLGVYTAYLYFYMLLKKIKSTDIEILLDKRVRISNFQKLFLLFRSFIDVKILSPRSIEL